MHSQHRFALSFLSFMLFSSLRRRSPHLRLSSFLSLLNVFICPFDQCVCTCLHSREIPRDEAVLCGSYNSMARSTPSVCSTWTMELFSWLLSGIPVNTVSYLRSPLRKMTFFFRSKLSSADYSISLKSSTERHRRPLLLVENKLFIRCSWSLSVFKTAYFFHHISMYIYIYQFRHTFCI